ncbi:MAG: hypothetical protein IRY98_12850, partial [Alicyclobacillaceae bacterium]|nr:hypothetical protein [Alicyclobacillaceae bacterium]
MAKVRALLDGLKELPYVDAHYVSPDARYVGFGGGPSNPMWILTFSAKDPAHPPTSASELPDMLSAEVDAVTGEVLSFSRQNPAWTGDRQPSRELATRVAAAFLQKIDPHWTDRWVEQVEGGRIIQSFSSNGKTLQWWSSAVTFSEKVHGIPFPQNRIDIYVDGFGHVVGMQVLRPFDSAKLPDPSGAIPLDKARDLLAGSIQLEKVYLTAPIKVDPSGHIHKESRPVLAYVPTRQPSIDALTGQPVQVGIPLSDIEVNKIVSITGQGQTLRAKDREAAKRLVENFLHLDPSNMTLVDSKETESPDPLGDSRRWELTWSSHSPAHPPASQDPADSAPAQPTWIHAEFDADTGQWVNLNMNM